ncbi:glycosyltransferase family 32 protein [Oliverpabstia intestinalis]|uniref:glycosyltransferase family 32 protein n=1 Tax=Oliverpabstia intestinalis TaxID=2606633 RepID=UPI003F8CAAAA
MIPKIIHYIWVGGKEKPVDIKRCMATWKRHLEGYKVIEWNESNFDIEQHPFVKAAYEAKKWAYVSDYIRAYAIYNYGGIYLDTDILLLDNFDDFLNHRAFVGFENPNYPFTAAFGAEKGHPLVKDMLDYYDELDTYHFDFKNNNTISVSDILINKYGCKVGNMYQVLKEGIAVYPDTILCNPSEKSVSIHVFTGTWLDEKKAIARKINTFLKLRITNRKRAALFRKYIMRV